jgi:chemotaxis protein MotA
VDFLCDYLRMMVGGNLNAFEIENLMDIEMETHHHEAHMPAHVVSKVADGVPAFGIVVAVMGVVNVMGSVGQPPAVLGKMIGGALVGTFLGILVSYGFVAPVAGQLEQKVEEGGKIYQCMKAVLLASMNGYAPQVAVEFGRKVLFRPIARALPSWKKPSRARSDECPMMRRDAAASRPCGVLS